MSDPYRPKPGIFLGPPPDPISVDPAQVEPPSNLAPPSTTAGMTDSESPKADTLADAARSVLTCCRECRDEMPVFSTNVPPAEFIVWGKLLPPEALGPKCYDHAVKYLGHDVGYRSIGYAVVDLRPIRAALAAHDQQREAAQ